MMYAAQSGDGQGDFASVGIKDQHLEFRFDTGSGIKRNILYMVNLVAVDRVWPFTTCPVLFGQTGIWQNWLGSWPRWWNFEIKVNSIQVKDHQVHPVEACNQCSRVI